MPSTPPPTPPLDLESATPPRRRSPLIPGFHNPPPFLVFLRHNWYDIGTQLLCLLLALLLYSFVPPIMPRHFPLFPDIEKTAWGMKHSQPYLREYVDTIVSAVVSFVVPAAVMGGIALWGTRSFEDGNAALIGLGYALATSTLFNSFLKLFVGGLRPHFLTICAPINPPSFQGLASTSKTDMRFYTAAQVCTGPSRRVREAQMSFPSGHASAAFAGFVFLALYLNAKYKVLSRGTHFRDSYGERQTSAEEEVTGKRVHHWKLVLFVVPWCIALVLALSKIRDRWHHPVDVVFGALLGTLFAHMAFKMVYWSVYDARTNHIPLGEKEEGKNANEEGKSAKEEGESAKEGKEV